MSSMPLGSIDGSKSYLVAPRSNDAVDDEVTYLAHIITNMFFLCLMSILLGSRAGNLRLRDIFSTDWLRFNVILIYIFGIGLVLVTVVVIAGVGVGEIHGCYTALMVCAFFYLGGKIFMYIFLIERAHVIAIPYRSRLKDVQWIMNMMLLLAGFIAISALAFGWPIVSIAVDGRCRVGFPGYTTVSMLVWDTCMNITVTGVFLYKLYPYLTLRPTQLGPNQCQKEGSLRSRILAKFRLQNLCPHQHATAGVLQRLLLRTIIAGVLMMLATTANIIVLLKMQGHQKIRLCLIMCPMDVTWTVCVLHWLTHDPAKDRCNIPNHQNLKNETPNIMSPNREIHLTLNTVDSNSTLRDGPNSPVHNSSNSFDIEAGIPDQHATKSIVNSVIVINDATKEDGVC